MDFANETYVRLYVRDTTTWLRLGWDGQSVLMQTLRKLDMAGVMDIGDMEPWEAVVVHCRAPEDAAERGMEVCLRLGVLVHNGTFLAAPNFRDAQETVKSDKQRQKESRARRRATAVATDGRLSQPVTAMSRNVTPESRLVTTGHDGSRLVTHCVTDTDTDTDTAAAAGHASPDAAAALDLGTHSPDDTGKTYVTAADAHRLTVECSGRTYPPHTFKQVFGDIAAQANAEADPHAALEAATRHYWRLDGWAMCAGQSTSGPKHLAGGFHRELAEANGAKPPQRIRPADIARTTAPRTATPVVTLPAPEQTAEDVAAREAASAAFRASRGNA